VAEDFSKAERQPSQLKVRPPVNQEIDAIPMKCRKWLLLFLILAAVVSFTVEYSYGANQLTVTVSTDKQSYDPGQAVLITGRVLDQSMNGVTLASISIQVNNSTGNAIHVGWILSNAHGYYGDEFIARNDSMNGGYSIYVTASKPGYADATAQAGYIVAPEFQASHVQWLMLLPVLFLVLFAEKRKRASINRGMVEERNAEYEVSSDLNHPVAADLHSETQTELRIRAVIEALHEQGISVSDIRCIHCHARLVDLAHITVTSSGPVGPECIKGQQQVIRLREVTHRLGSDRFS